MPNAAASAGSKAGTETNPAADFSLDTVMGLDRYIAPNNPFDIEVSVECINDFTGSIKVTPETSAAYGIYAAQVAYGQDFVLSAAEAKAFKFTLPPPGTYYYRYNVVRIEIIDEKGQTVHSEQVSVNMDQDSSSYLNLGILSDDLMALNYFNGVDLSLPTSPVRVRLINLNDDFPEQAAVLGACQMILLNDYNTDKLSDRQYRALQEWVESGGVLLVGTGAKYQNVFNKFDRQFLSGTAKGLSQTTMTVNGERVEGVDVLDLDFPGFTPLNGFVKPSLVAVSERGFGRVALLKFNPGMEPLTDWSQRTGLVQELLVCAAGSQTENWIGGYEQVGLSVSSYGMSYDVPTGLSDRTPRPNAVLYGVIFTAYFLFAGPFLYLILKKQGRRERLWAAIGLTAVGFTIVIFITGLFYRVNRPIINNFALIDTDGGYQKEVLISSIILPRSRSYDLPLAAEWQDFTAIQTDDYYSDYYSYTDNAKDEVLYTVNNQDGIALKINKSDNISTIAFAISKRADDDIGQLKVIKGADGAEDMIVNNTKYHLSEVTVAYGDHYYFAESIPSGASRAIMPERIKDAGSISSGTYGATVMSEQYGKAASRNINNGAIRPRSRIYLIQLYMQELWLNSCAEGQGMVWGIIDEYDPEVVTRTAAKQYSDGVLFSHFTIDELSDF